MDAVHRQSMAMTLQDLKCIKCKQVSKVQQVQGAKVSLIDTLAVEMDQGQ